MKDIKYIRDYYNKYYTNELDFYWNKTKILNAFKTYENDYRQGKWLSKRMGIKGNETILDCGCGIGGTMKQIALLHPNTNVYGINISDGQIKMAEKVLEGLDNCSLSVQDYTNTNYEDGRYFTGQELNIPIYFHKRNHNYSSTNLRKKACLK